MRSKLSKEEKELMKVPVIKENCKAKIKLVVDGGLSINDELETFGFPREENPKYDAITMPLSSTKK